MSLPPPRHLCCGMLLLYPKGPMFAIPLIAAPFLLLLVPYRLFKILLALWRHDVGFSLKGRPLLPILTVTIYAGLAAHTVLLLVAIGRVASAGQWSLQGLEPLLVLGSAYPVSYVAAEWIFFYGLQKLRPTPTALIGP